MAPNVDSALIGIFSEIGFSTVIAIVIVSSSDGKFWYLKVYYIVTVFGVLILKFFQTRKMDYRCLFSSYYLF
jgi:hypothetical protein